MPTIHENDLIRSLSNIFGSSKYSDVTVCCGSDVYKLHRAVICPRSDFFAAACDLGFKVHSERINESTKLLTMDWQESMTATIILNEDDQSTVRRMLTYLYTLDYDDGDACPAVAVATSQDTSSLVTDPVSKSHGEDDATVSHCKRMNNIRVYALAEKYNIPALKELAKTKFKNYKPASNPIHRSEVIEAILNSTPKTDTGLRNILISRATTASNLEEILNEGPLTSGIRDHGSFALEILRAVAKKHRKLRSLQHDGMEIRIPNRKDSQQAFERSYEAVGRFQEKVSHFWGSVKLED